jgi:hypothetical protein
MGVLECGNKKNQAQNNKFSTVKCFESDYLSLLFETQESRVTNQTGRSCESAEEFEKEDYFKVYKCHDVDVLSDASFQQNSRICILRYSLLLHMMI